MRHCYYAMWVTRNGQKMWSGPYPSTRRALAVLSMTLTEGSGFVAALVEPDDAMNAQALPGRTEGGT